MNVTHMMPQIFIEILIKVYNSRRFSPECVRTCICTACLGVRSFFLLLAQGMNNTFLQDYRTRFLVCFTHSSHLIICFRSSWGFFFFSSFFTDSLRQKQVSIWQVLLSDLLQPWGEENGMLRRYLEAKKKKKKILLRFFFFFLVQEVGGEKKKSIFQSPSWVRFLSHVLFCETAEWPLVEVNA